jgi:hypothetical protein
VAALGACRGVLGIDEDVPLLPAIEGGAPDDGAGTGTEGGPGADAAADVAAGFDADFDAGVTAVDRRYAVWPLPPDHPLLSSYVLGAETVTDKTTGLEWQRSDSDPATMSYGLGAAYCTGLTLGGQTDWRLPTRIEVETTLDFGQSPGLLNPTVFPDASMPGAPSQQWTDSISLLRAKLDDRIVVDVISGSVNVASKPLAPRATCAPESSGRSRRSPRRCCSMTRSSRATRSRSAA